MGSTLSKFIHSENILVRFLRYFTFRQTELEGEEELLNRIMDYHEGLGTAICVLYDNRIKPTFFAGEEYITESNYSPYFSSPAFERTIAAAMAYDSQVLIDTHCHLDFIQT